MRPILVLILSLFTVILPPKASLSAEVTWTFLVPFPAESTLGRHVQNFVELIPEFTGGQLAIEAEYEPTDTAATLYPEVYGTADILSSLSQQAAPLAVINLTDLPRSHPVSELVRDPTAVWGVAHARSFQTALQPVIKGALQEQRLELLSIFPAGFRGLFTKTPVDRPADMQGRSGLAFDDVHADLLRGLGAEVQPTSRFMDDFAKGSTDVAVATPTIVFSDHPVPYNYFYDLQLQPTFYGLVADADQFASLDAPTREHLYRLGSMLEDDVWAKARDAHLRSLRELFRRNVKIKAASGAWHEVLAERSPTLAEGIWTLVQDRAGPETLESIRSLQEQIKGYYQLQSASTPSADRLRHSLVCKIAPVFFATNRTRRAPGEYAEGPDAADPIFGLMHLLLIGLGGGAETSGSCQLSEYEDRCGTATGVGECIAKIMELSVDDFKAQLRDVFSETPRSALFIHGYNTSFEDAAIGLSGRLKHSFGSGTAGIMFSWPSYEKMSKYDRDREVVDQSIEAFNDVLNVLEASKPTWPWSDHELNIVAHSLGSYLVTQAFAHASSADVHVGTVVLLAPDVSAAELSDAMAREPDAARSVTLYCAQSDDALRMSMWRNGRVPLGLLKYPVPPEAEFETLLMRDQIDAVHVAEEVNQRKTYQGRHNTLGHSYYLNPIVQDDVKLVLEGVPPGKRPNMTLELFDLGRS